MLTKTLHVIIFLYSLNKYNNMWTFIFEPAHVKWYMFYHIREQRRLRWAYTSYAGSSELHIPRRLTRVFVVWSHNMSCYIFVYLRKHHSAEAGVRERYGRIHQNPGTQPGENGTGSSGQTSGSATQETRLMSGIDYRWMVSRLKENTFCAKFMKN